MKYQSATELIIIQMFFVLFAYELLLLLPKTDSLFFIVVTVLSIFLNLCSAFFIKNKYSLSIRFLTLIISFFTMFHFIYSPIKINHFFHYWTYVHILFSLSTLVNPKKTLLYAQLIIFSTYTLSGFWKVIGMVKYCSHGATNCDTNQLSLTVLSRILETGNSPVFANFFISHTELSFFSFLFVTLFQSASFFLFLLTISNERYKNFEVFLVVILVAFHVLVALTLGVFFLDLVLLHFVLFLLPKIIDN